MKTIEVVAAIIINEKKLFIAERGYGNWKGYYELPGGKIEPGETKEEALRREISEELDTEVNVGDFITTIEYDYTEFRLTMHCYQCTIQNGTLELLEHSASKWVTSEELLHVKWLPADELLIETLQRLLEKEEHRNKKTKEIL